MIKRFLAKFVMLLGLLMLAPALWANDFMGGLGGLLEGVSKHAMPAGNQHAPYHASSLSYGDVVAGLKEALRIGSERVVARLSKQDGFYRDGHIHIPLPDSMQRVKSALAMVGMASLLDDLELRLNRAAEAATPKAKRLFMDAIHSMKIADARAILEGKDDAATQYFKGKMSKPLSKAMKPIVDDALAQTGVVQAYERVMGEYQALPFVPDVKADLSEHVLRWALRGVFYYMAKEEAAIRKNPVKRTTAILKQVFG